MTISQTAYAQAMAQSYYPNTPYIDSAFALHADGTASFVRHFTGTSAYPDLSLGASATLLNQQISADLNLLQTGGLPTAGISVETVFHLFLAEQRGLISAQDLASLSANLGNTPVLGQSSGSSYQTAAEVLANAPGALAQVNLTGLAFVQSSQPAGGSNGGAITPMQASSLDEPPVPATANSLNFNLGQTQDIAALYVAFFDRAPDQAGLSWWTNQMQGGGGNASFTQIAAAFSADANAAAIYHGLNHGDMVNRIYSNVVGSGGDAHGIAYWTAQLDQGTPLSDMIASFVTAVLNVDLNSQLAAGFITQADYDIALRGKNTLIDKAVVATDFVTRFAAATNPASTADLSSDNAFKASIAVLAQVSDDSYVAANQINNMARVQANTPNNAAAIALIGSHDTLAQSAAELVTWY